MHGGSSRPDRFEIKTFPYLSEKFDSARGTTCAKNLFINRDRGSIRGAAFINEMRIPGGPRWLRSPELGGQVRRIS